VVKDLLEDIVARGVIRTRSQPRFIGAKGERSHNVYSSVLIRLLILGTTTDLRAG